MAVLGDGSLHSEIAGNKDCACLASFSLFGSDGCLLCVLGVEQQWNFRSIAMTSV